MTGVQYMEIANLNTASGSYEVTGNSNLADAYIIGDKVETSTFPSNTLESGVTITVPSN